MIHRYFSAKRISWYLFGEIRRGARRRRSQTAPGTLGPAWSVGYFTGLQNTLSVRIAQLGGILKAPVEMLLHANESMIVCANKITIVRPCM
jgi:hypothetical protein